MSAAGSAALLAVYAVLVTAWMTNPGLDGFLSFARDELSGQRPSGLTGGAFSGGHQGRQEVLSVSNFKGPPGPAGNLVGHAIMGGIGLSAVPLLPYVC